jgi:hypothetical protein
MTDLGFIETIVGTGFAGIFGNSIMLGVFALIFIIGLCFALRATADIFFVGTLTGILIIANAFFPWFKWLALVGVGFIVGLFIFRILRR